MTEDRRRGGRAGEALSERAQQLRAKLHSDAYDPAAYRLLMDDLRGAAMSDDVRRAYEELVAAFPTAVGIWTRYVEAEMAAGNTEAVKAVFGRCLMQCPSVDLWFMYLKFIKRTNEPRGPEGVLETKQAYEFTLDTIGQDIHSGPLWQEYISFLSGPKPGSPAYSALWSSGMVGGQEESTKTAALRRAYQRAIVVPTHSLELIWKNYEAFESTTAAAAAAAASASAGGGAAAARQFGTRVVSEQRPRFQAARMAYRERKRRMEGIDTAALPVPPGRGGPGQQEQIKLWKGFLEYERSNPQRLEHAALTQRVELAYMQALMCLLHFPEVWCDYARWHADSGGGVAQATACLLRAVAALPDCLLLHFALADLEEAQGNADAAREVYEALVRQLEPLPGDAAGAQQQQQPNGQEAAAGSAAPDGAAPGAAAAAAEPPRPAGGPVTSLPPDQAALVWVQYMRFARRESVMASRRMFIRAKKSPCCPWQVYVAAALMEWRHAREQGVARRIFEKGLEVAEFATTPEFILAYADFLCDVGDADNTRALFERVLTEEANRRCAPLWERYLSFEFEMGDLQSALRLEKRAREALGDGAGGGAGGGGGPGGGGSGSGPGGGGSAASSARNMQLMLLRYQFLDALPCPPGSKPYLLHLVGRGPPPPGFERGRGRSAGAGGGGGGGGAAADGEPGGPSGRPSDDRGGERERDRDRDRGEPPERGWDRGGDRRHAPPPHEPPARGGGGLPPLLDRFLHCLPPPELLDGPMPDLNLVVDSLYDSLDAAEAAERDGGGGGGVDGAAVGGGGVKREFEGDDGGGGGALAGGGPGRDVYRARAKQRARLAGGGGMD